MELKLSRRLESGAAHWRVVESLWIWIWLWLWLRLRIVCHRIYSNSKCAPQSPLSPSSGLYLCFILCLCRCRCHGFVVNHRHLRQQAKFIRWCAWPAPSSKRSLCSVLCALFSVLCSVHCSDYINWWWSWAATWDATQNVAEWSVKCALGSSLFLFSWFFFYLPQCNITQWQLAVKRQFYKELW